MERAARQLLRAMRGKRSQVAMSRRLGYRGNVVAKWEAGQRFPTFGEVLRACGRVGVDVPAALAAFHGPSAPAWDPERPEELGAWLRVLQGQVTQAALAERTGLSRQQIGRLLSGRTRGRLPLVMTLVDAMTSRLPDLVAALVPIALVPELARAANIRQALARLAFAHPWSPAAQAWLGTRGEVPAATAAFRLATDMGIPGPLAEELVAALVEAGVAEVARGKLRPASRATVEISASADDVKRLRGHWARVSADRMADQPPGDLFSFNVFAVKRDDLERIKQAQRRFYREVRAIVSESEPEVVALLVVHTAGLVT
jgi:transcriptional regulator with XRE-family HTH domain